MKKHVIILLLLIILASAASAEEPLMWASQSDPETHSSDNFRNNPPVYPHPMQYQLVLLPLAVTTLPEELPSKAFGPVSTGQDGHELAITSGHPWFGENAHARLNPGFPGPDDRPPDTHPVQQLRNLLKDIGWTEACEPDLYCTASEVVRRGTFPDESGTYYTRGIPEESWDDLWFVHFTQHIDGLPLDIWVYHASDDEYETRDASFVLDTEGRIITGRVFPGYEIVSGSEITDPLLSAYEAGECFFDTMKYIYEESKTWDGFEHYEYSWEITGFEAGLIQRHNLTAVPCWRIQYQRIMTDELTGEQFRNARDYTINALAGK